MKANKRKKAPPRKAWGLKLANGRLDTWVDETKRDMQLHLGRGESVVRVEIRELR